MFICLIFQQYTRFVKPSYDDHVHPTVKHADVVSIYIYIYNSNEVFKWTNIFLFFIAIQIIPRGLENAVAIDLITKHVQRQLNEKELHLRWDLVKSSIGDGIPEDVTVLPSTNQIKVI